MSTGENKAQRVTEGFPIGVERPNKAGVGDKHKGRLAVFVQGMKKTL